MNWLAWPEPQARFARTTSGLRKPASSAAGPGCTRAASRWFHPWRGAGSLPGSGPTGGPFPPFKKKICNCSAIGHFTRCFIKSSPSYPRRLVSQGSMTLMSTVAGFPPSRERRNGRQLSIYKNIGQICLWRLPDISRQLCYL